MCNASIPLLGTNSFHHDNPAFENLRDQVMAESPDVREFLQPLEAEELAQEERHEEQFDAALAEFREPADGQSETCEPQSALPQLLQRI